jgi:hypothetical protein
MSDDLQSAKCRTCGLLLRRDHSVVDLRQCVDKLIQRDWCQGEIHEFYAAERNRLEPILTSPIQIPWGNVVAK